MNRHSVDIVGVALQCVRDFLVRVDAHNVVYPRRAQHDLEAASCIAGLRRPRNGLRPYPKMQIHKVVYRRNTRVLAKVNLNTKSW